MSLTERCTVDGPVHFTHLKKMALSPAHYLASLDDDSDTPTFRWGRIVHLALLGGGDMAVFEGDKTKDRKLWKEFQAQHEDAEIVTVKERDLALRVADAVRADPVAGQLIAGDFERLIEWEFLGRKCGSHLDILNRGTILNNGRRFLADLKCVPCAKPEKFRFDCLRYGYHAQGAFYQDAARYIGVDVEDVYIIGVEAKKEPFAVTVFHVSPRALEEGRKLCRLWMERLLACEAAGAWPGYCQSVVELDIEEDLGLVFGDEEEAA